MNSIKEANNTNDKEELQFDKWFLIEFYTLIFFYNIIYHFMC